MGWITEEIERAKMEAKQDEQIDEIENEIRYYSIGDLIDLLPVNRVVELREEVKEEVIELVQQGKIKLM